MVAASSSALQQRLRLLRRMGLASVGVLQPFGAGADRQEPVGARLDVVVARLQRFVVEGVALGVGAARRPDHRLVGVGEAPAAEVRHRIGFAPDDVVEDPEAEVLQDRADAEDVVIGADDDDRRVALHHPPRRAEPGAGERVIGGEVGELVPIVVDRVDHALIGARQRAFELQIVRRIGEDEIDARLGQPGEFGDAVADDDRVARRGGRRGGAPRLVASSTQNLKLDGEAGRPGTRTTHYATHLTRPSGRTALTRAIMSILGKGGVRPARSAAVSFSYGFGGAKNLYQINDF